MGMDTEQPKAGSHESGPAFKRPGVQDAAALSRFIAAHERLFVLTGAGCSTGSGIPDYRDADGVWKGAQPMLHQTFIHNAEQRRRYWARSMAGWPAIAGAQPNAAHAALARLQERGRVAGLVTQNVDGLHAAAGSRGVVSLHGRLHRVQCLQCDTQYRRDFIQRLLLAANPDWQAQSTTLRPDGDIELEAADYQQFRVPACPRCGGMLKPDVVFFGGSVPKTRVARAWRRLQLADAVLVVGSSLMVWSGYRYVRAAAQQRLPIAAVNRGKTRADAWLDIKIDADCSTLLAAAVA